jgi:type-F conjugative transfer system pilin assembly protein TrbC
MKRRLIFLSPFLSLSLLYSVTYADDFSDLISRSEPSGTKAANEASQLIDNLHDKASQESASADKAANSLNNRIGVFSNQEPTLSSVKSSSSTLPRKYPKQEALKDISLANEGNGKCKDSAYQSLGKCSSSFLKGLEAKQSLDFSSNPQLFIFVSQSVPASSIKELWSQAQRVGGKLLFRGLVGGSFKETEKHIQELGIVADIDPTKFEEFEVIHVPTFVLSKTPASPTIVSLARVSLADKYDKIIGNVSLNEFLEQSSISGDLKGDAKILHKKLQEEKQ